MDLCCEKGREYNVIYNFVHQSIEMGGGKKQLFCQDSFVYLVFIYIEYNKYMEHLNELEPVCLLLFLSAIQVS